ncbi:Unknown protein sequence [Pseudomonas amygdali pv. lachrymans]|nr:Unknown protein sequence [Pseudomonas amygdali pv. lachrymans]RMM39311.1 hypothetical protein ALQ79_200248 [Pseudomonas amygdali pv. lachrymans]
MVIKLKHPKYDKGCNYLGLLSRSLIKIPQQFNPKISFQQAG